MRLSVALVPESDPAANRISTIFWPCETTSSRFLRALNDSPTKPELAASEMSL